MNNMSKNQYESFQDNVNGLVREEGDNIQQKFTPFGLLEFAGLTLKQILKIQYKGKLLKEYPFKSYKEFEDDFTPFLKEQIQIKITKNYLKEKLVEKQQRDLKYLNQRGISYIKKYTEIIDAIHDNLINSLFLDQLSQVNISQLSLKDRDKFIILCMNKAIEIICQKQIMGSLRLISKIAPEIKITQDKTGEFSGDCFNIDKQKRKIAEGLKPNRDFVDCELIHLAFFGANDNIFHCYTTDNETEIKERLFFYCRYINFFIWLFFKYTKLNDMPPSFIARKHSNPPEWRYGTVFILDKKTGEKIKEISAQKIHKQVRISSD